MAIVDVSEMRTVFAELRSQMDDLQKSFYAVEQMYISEFVRLEQRLIESYTDNKKLLERNIDLANGKIQDT